MNNDRIRNLLEQIKPLIKIRYSAEERPKVENFIGQVLDLFPLHDLVRTPVEDVSGSLLGLWDYFQRVPPTGKIRVFNPTLDEDGWVTPRTVIFIVKRDMPFLVDSVRIALNCRGLGIHFIKSTIFRVERDVQYNLIRATSVDPGTTDGMREAVMFFEVDLHSWKDELDDLKSGIVDVLLNVEAAVDHYRPMLERVQTLIDNTRKVYAGKITELIEQSLEFLEWLRDGFYTFLGSTEYQLCEIEGREVLQELPERRLGVYTCRGNKEKAALLDELSCGLRDFLDSDQLLTFTKSSVRSQIHRHVYSDYVIVKTFDGQGKVVGEVRFLGLYTSGVYNMSPHKIPMVRDKIKRVMERSRVSPSSHDGKTLRQIIETYPREELIHSTEEELLETTIGIMQINERRIVRLFMRVDPFGKYVNCLVFIPRDVYCTEVREKIEHYLRDVFDAGESEFTTHFSESMLTRTLFTLRINSDRYRTVDVAILEEELEHISKSWEEQLTAASIQNWGEEEGRRLARKYAQAFPAGYQEHFDARMAVHDIELFDGLDNESDIAMSFYQPPGSQQRMMRFKLFHYCHQVELSKLLPMLENLGFRVLGEHPYRIECDAETSCWIHDFTLHYCLDVDVDVPAVRNNFQEAFKAIWRGDSESDSFNRLVLGARLDWRSVGMLRTYARYIKQLGLNLSQEFIADTLSRNLEITRNLVALFKILFEPRFVEEAGHGEERAERLRGRIHEALEAVPNLNEDQVLRFYLKLINATLRTNFFQCNADGSAKPYLSIKLATQRIKEAPQPRPLYEIFVYSPRVEGVHLRAGKVARGGVRWSDRIEDYRKEVLGLMKAQQVKNAVIVPTGAKGGFVGKKLAHISDRKQYREEGVECYKIFIRGLLDITDNIQNGRVIPPKDVVRRDEDDPYLVVAADKGTAGFSDIANEISFDYGHWLGDAFASGGGQGYDHKDMGITARGAWVAVQRHFREMGVNIQREDFTVVGIGDMSGDVFGNGMLLSEHIQLVAAFNHQHIFLDPNPKPDVSLNERWRLFNLPRSSWDDYDRKLLSEGGGVFPRSAKSIPLSEQVRKRFNIEAEALTPNELINRLLKARVDLLWNGGVGTFVKASEESHGDVGDRANDSLRVNGNELCCRVVGEGGNLGLTQLGRVEFCFNGGRCYTDFVDNSAGVDCSDHEVNIKILLNGLVAAEDLTVKQRNQLLAEMTDEVANLVLEDNYFQTGAISLAQFAAGRNFSDYWRLMMEMESEGHLDRVLENLPDDETMSERQAQGLSLTQPELAVLISYAKDGLEEKLLNSDAPDDPYLANIIETAFPPRMRGPYRNQIHQHSLKREIIATQLANQIVNRMGPTFCMRQVRSTGSSCAEIARAWAIIRDLFQLERVWREVESMDYRVSSTAQLEILADFMRLGRRSVRWMLRNRRSGLKPQFEINQIHDSMEKMQELVPNFLAPEQHQEWRTTYEELITQGFTEPTARLVASANGLYFALGVVDVAIQVGISVEEVAKVYFKLGEELSLEWFADQIIDLVPETRWQEFARESFVDDLESQRRMLTRLILGNYSGNGDYEQVIDRWLASQELLVNRWLNMVRELRASPTVDFAMYSVALRTLLDLVQASQNDKLTPWPRPSIGAG